MNIERLAIVGAFGGTHIGGSLSRAARALGIATIEFDTREAASGNRVLDALAWRLADRRPLRLRRFAAKVAEACREQRPQILVSTGMAPLTPAALQAIRAMGIVSVNYSTDDPWNPAQRARWFLRALPLYDHVFTPRSANIEDFQRLGCPDVRRLPFGYDDGLFRPSAATPATPVSNVLFVGGADADRVAFMTAFMRNGPAPALAGVYWDRHPAMRSHAIGVKSPDELSRLTAAAKVNLCLVRRANRDGHVMRSFEIAAIGGCMLAEDTAEHREIFGEDGESVAYFDSPESAARRARELIADPGERRRLALAVRERVARGGHTYRDRLLAMLATFGHDRENLRPAAERNS